MIKSFFISIFGQDLIKEKTELQYQMLELQTVNKRMQTICLEKDDIIKDLDNENHALRQPHVTNLDLYCIGHFKKIEMPAYKQKRHIKGKYYSIALNQLITPNAYEVVKFKKGISTTNNMLQNASNIGNAIAKHLIWDSDNDLDSSGDYYLYPEETIARKKGDCEDHAGVVSSMNEEIGMAYGSEKDMGWHCFNVFVYQGNLFVLDTVGNSAIVSLLNKTNYKIYYIITTNNAYQIDGSETFGVLAGW